MEKVEVDKYKMASFYLELQEIEEFILSLEWSTEVSESIKERWHHGHPLLGELLPKIDGALLVKVLRAVVQACQKGQLELQIPDTFLPQIKELTEENLQKLAQDMLQYVPDHMLDWSKKLKLDLPTLNFISQHVAGKILPGYAVSLMKQVDMSQWKEGYCPVCGAEPVMSRLTKDSGGRKLYCGRCNIDWRYDRLGCPFCGNKDSEKISYLSAEGFKQYRIYLCDVCKSYLKTVDERCCGEVDLFCEDLATADFDELVLQMGYQRGNKRVKV